MSKNGPAEGPDDPRVAVAVTLSFQAPSFTLPQVMRAALFTDDDSKSAKCQMWVRRQIKRKKGKQEDSIINTTVDTNSPGTTISSITTPASNKTCEPKHPPPKTKQIRRTATGMQQARVNKHNTKEHRKSAHKFATTLYAAEKNKEDGKSAAEVRDETIEVFGVAPGVRTIQTYVKDGKAGVSPKRQGPKGNLADHLFVAICNAVLTNTKINQLNGMGSEGTRKKIQSKIDAVLGDDAGKYSFQFVDRVLNVIAAELLAGKGNDVEQRRIIWTTFKNLKMWFEVWERVTGRRRRTGALNWTRSRPRARLL